MVYHCDACHEDCDHCFNLLRWKAWGLMWRAIAYMEAAMVWATRASDLWQLHGPKRREECRAQLVHFLRCQS